MATNITKSDSTIISIADQQVDSDQLSIPLVGRNYRGYGQFITTSLVHLLENFSSASEPANPTEGQLWWDTSGLGELKLRHEDAWLVIPYKEGEDYIFDGNILPLQDCTNGDYNIGSPTRQFCTGYINVLEGVAARARYADLAELYKGDDILSPGTLVAIGGEEEITKATDAADVFGVISSDPAFLMNSEAKGDDMYPVALTGRVPVLVIGPVSKGQKLCLSDFPGVARAMLPGEDALVIGRALKTNLGESQKLVESVVTANI